MTETTKYTRTAMFLHWTIALLMIANVALGWTASLVPDEDVRSVVDVHKSIGITVLGLAIMRLLWRFAYRPPPLPAVYPIWERRSAHIAHFLLYVLIFLLPISGWMHDSAWKDAATHPMKLFGLVDWPRIGWIMNIEQPRREMLHDAFGSLHTYAGFVLYALFILHVGGALKHQYIDRKPELERMLP